MFYNFGPLIRHRVNFYFLSMMPRKLLYFFVVILAIAGAGILEASGNANSKRIIKETIFNRIGDDLVLHGNLPEAMANYRTSIQEARGSVKGNYNLAILEWSMLGDDQLEKVQGKRDRLSAQIQEAYGVTHDEAEKQLSEWQRFQKLDNVS